jgi:hypothetical protein
MLFWRYGILEMPNISSRLSALSIICKTRHGKRTYPTGPEGMPSACSQSHPSMFPCSKFMRCGPDGLKALVEPFEKSSWSCQETPIWSFDPLATNTSRSMLTFLCWMFLTYHLYLRELCPTLSYRDRFQDTDAITPIFSPNSFNRYQVSGVIFNCVAPLRKSL